MSDSSLTTTPSAPLPRREVIGLGLLFGAMYFIQGIGEPTAGLISQPVLKILKDWQQSPAEIGTFMMLLGLPWSIKPLYGLLTDFVPIRGSRRRSYLLLASLATAVGLSAAFAMPLGKNASTQLLLVLLVPTVGVAFTDVVVDALMIEKGQPAGLTGRLQSIQWASIYAATILTGTLGGYLSQTNQESLGFAICGLLALATFVLVAICVKEPPRTAPTESFAQVRRTLWRAVTQPTILLVGAFLCLWNFNPFTGSMLNYYYTQELKFSEQFYGNLLSVGAGASIAASIAYGFYCRRVPFGVLLHLSIVCGIVSVLGYGAVYDARSAIVTTLIVDFFYMTGMLIQLDLAARACPPGSAGTVFALLMSLTNLSTSLAAYCGGQAYEVFEATTDSNRVAFLGLIVIGSLATAACWTLVPFMRRATA